MIANLPTGQSPAEPVLHLVNHGKSGGLGCFVADLPLKLGRGTAVVVESMRGLEAGRVVGPASQRHARMLGPTLAGRLLRPFTDGDEQLWQRHQQLAQVIFQRARIWAGERQLPLEILDVDILFDGSQAILQFLGQDEAGLESLAGSLQAVFAPGIRFENLSPAPVEVPEEEHAGCGKPDCGKASGGSCSTCSTGGGCSSCAKGSGVDIKEYFGHLREKMEAKTDRIALL